ncbi:unnamed protein product [Brassica napus]|uniref:(rape) hypothetical protein n=1 Tax=Brassica napus TaxID=3708 RepID=A0A816SBZ4_BRANA|nr:unnamed protein product [Brassica napus]
MKNVAKCDTWCELQNPVNHRVFERKLRPKPSGRGHACLGVTNRRPPSSRGYGTEADIRVQTPVQKALDDPKSSTRPQDSLISGEAPSATDWAQVPWKGAPERVRAPSCSDPVAPRGAVYESGCLGMQPQSGGKFRPKAKYGRETDSEQVPRESQRVLEIVGREADGAAMHPWSDAEWSNPSADRFGAWTDAD